MTTTEQKSGADLIREMEQQAAQAAGVQQQIPRPDVTTAPASLKPEKRGRGRPSNAEKAARENAQAAINAASGRDEAAQKTGAASKAAKSKAEKVSINANKLAGQIQGLHIIAAKFTGIPILQLDDKEAFALAESIQNLAEQYEIKINPKVAAGLQLLGTAAMIYGPRYLMMVEAAKAYKAQQEAAARAAQQGA